MQRHELLAAAIRDSVNEEGFADVLLVIDRLSKSGRLEQVGGIDYLMSMVDVLPDVTNPAGWAREIKASAQRRRATESMRHVAFVDDSPEAIERAQRDLDELRATRGGEDINALNAFNALPQWPEMAQAARYGLLGEITKAIEPHTEADPVAILAQTIVSFGCAVGRGPHTVVEADRHGCNENVVLVGDTAHGRKGTSAAYVRRLIAMADEVFHRERVHSGLSSGEGLIWPIRDAISKYMSNQGTRKSTGEGSWVVVDPGVNDKRLLIQEGEFAQALKVLGREGNTLSPVLRNAWDSLNLSTLTKNSPARATDPHVSIIGHITGTELKRLLSETEAANGFANRFMWFCVKRSKLLPEGGNFTDGRCASRGRSETGARLWAKGWRDPAQC